jgi:hypothetical protein
LKQSCEQDEGREMSRRYGQRKGKGNRRGKRKRRGKKERKKEVEK